MDAKENNENKNEKLELETKGISLALLLLIIIVSIIVGFKLGRVIEPEKTADLDGNTEIADKNTVANDTNSNDNGETEENNTDSQVVVAQTNYDIQIDEVDLNGNVVQVATDILQLNNNSSIYVADRKNSTRKFRLI